MNGLEISYDFPHNLTRQPAWQVNKGGASRIDDNTIAADHFVLEEETTFIIGEIRHPLTERAR